MNERLENVLREMLQRNEAIRNLLTDLLDEKATSNEAKKGMIAFKSDKCVSFMLNNKAYIGCLAKDLFLTDKIVEFYLYTDVDSDKAVFCSLHGDMPCLHVNFDDIINIRYSNDNEIHLLASNCAENDLFFDKKTHKVYPYKIQRAKKGGSYYGIFINNDSVDIVPCTDTYSTIDDKRFLEGRYFLSKDDAVEFITSCYEDKLKERSIL